MYSKLRAAQEAGRKGIETSLIRGDVPAALIQVARNRPVGTRIGGTRAGRRR
jgi:glutamate 5-kinase